jgi:transcriptional regulator with XRE-family HTH domain
MTQKELATRAGVRQQTISDIESGRETPRFSTLRKIAEALHVDAKELIGDLPRPG